MTRQELKSFLDKKVDEYNQPSFVVHDPVSIPHSFSRKQDIEISGFFAALFSWGNRTTIIRKGRELMQRMDNAPHDFITNHKKNDLNALAGFMHRTFTVDDLSYFIDFLRRHYAEYDSLESAFFREKGGEVETGLNHFRKYFFEKEHLKRTEKHISSPLQGSTCKRLNMYLRWMVRHDNRGVDFGIWKHITPARLICPVDVHVARVSRKMGLINRKQVDWTTAVELTGELRKLDKNDPVKYDIALFGLGAMEKLNWTFIK